MRTSISASLSALVTTWRSTASGTFRRWRRETTWREGFEKSTGQRTREKSFPPLIFGAWTTSTWVRARRRTPAETLPRKRPLMMFRPRAPTTIREGRSFPARSRIAPVMSPSTASTRRSVASRPHPRRVALSRASAASASPVEGAGPERRGMRGARPCSRTWTRITSRAVGISGIRAAVARASSEKSVAKRTLSNIVVSRGRHRHPPVPGVRDHDRGMEGGGDKSVVPLSKR